MRHPILTNSSGICLYTFGTDRHQFHALAGDEVERFVDVGDLVKAHLAPVGFRQRLAGNDFQQQHELKTVAEVFLDVLDGRARFAQVRVAPRRESLRTGQNNAFFFKSKPPLTSNKQHRIYRQ